MKLINLVIPPAPAPPEYGPATNRSAAVGPGLGPAGCSRPSPVLRDGAN